MSLFAHAMCPDHLWSIYVHHSTGIVSSLFVTLEVFPMILPYHAVTCSCHRLRMHRRVLLRRFCAEQDPALAECVGRCAADQSKPRSPYHQLLKRHFCEAILTPYALKYVQDVWVSEITTELFFVVVQSVALRNNAETSITRSGRVTLGKCDTNVQSVNCAPDRTQVSPHQHFVS